ncbi:MAG: type IVB secretion system protein DotG/IcmE [Legionellales bacterium]
MPSKKDNIKSLFSNTRSRVIILFTLTLMIAAVVIGYVKLRSSTATPLASAEVATNVAGGMRSIPGSMDPTAQYAKLQEQQNESLAHKAVTSGGSAIPTIIRTQAVGQGVGVVGSKEGKTGVGFATLAREDQTGAQQSLWIQDLKNGSCSKSVVTKVVSQGAQLSDLKAACTCVQLKDVGYSLQDLEPVCDCGELKAAGYNARQLKDAGYTASKLSKCGFNACEERNAGFSAQEMKDGGYSDGELKGAGFSESEISKASGLPDGISLADVRNSGCGVAALKKLRQSGVSGSAIRRINGCSAEQLKAAGYTAKELKDAGFSAADLKRAGFTPDQLKAAGFTARDLLDAGFSPADLAKAGFTAAEIKAAQTQLSPGISIDDIKNNGCDVDVLKKEREAGVSATLIKRYAGCSAQALKAAGFTDDDLANAGFTAQEIKEAIPLSDAAIKAAGCDANKLKKLFDAGVSAKKIKTLNGCSAESLKNAGYNIKSLADAGFTPAELLAAGFTAKQIEDAELNPAAVIASGRTADCSVDSLKKARAAGVSALTIKQTLGCSAAALKDSGYSATDLKNAGFTAAELKNAGFSAKALKDAGFSAKELHDAGFTAQQLKDSGFSAKDLKDAGFSAKDLKDAGFSVKDLKNAGFSAKDLKDAGYLAADISAAGFSDKDLQDAGFSMAGLPSAPKVQQQTSTIGGIPSIAGRRPTPAAQAATNASNSLQLQAILAKQGQQMADQKYQQKIQQRTSEMLSAATQSLSEWKKVNTQTYAGGSDDVKKSAGSGGAVAGMRSTKVQQGIETGITHRSKRAVIKTGDILFAVIDTAINSDEPGPILATIVTGKLKGAKLIGSFNLPSNANKMIITFNLISIPGAEKTTSISAYAIDPNTARTALSSQTNHHYMMRYGALFASSFIQGFGNAIQSANTTITIGGTGGTNNVTVTGGGIGQSTLESAVIGLSTVGKNWGQHAQELLNTPTTVQVYSGTGLGILFMQDVIII